MQHVVAMFGATFLVPLITGFPPTTTILFSGVGTLVFLVVTRNKIPSYLGSSFAFISPVIASMGADKNMGLALSGIVAAGLLLFVIGLIVNQIGHAVDQPPHAAGRDRLDRGPDRFEPRAGGGQERRQQLGLLAPDDAGHSRDRGDLERVPRTHFDFRRRPCELDHRRHHRRPRSEIDRGAARRGRGSVCRRSPIRPSRSGRSC